MASTAVRLPEFSLPCEVCTMPVTISAAQPKRFIDDWLDGIVTVRCLVHRARNTTP